MSPETKSALRKFADFLFENTDADTCDTYVEALKILEEEAKDNWTVDDVIDAAIRAQERKE